MITKIAYIRKKRRQKKLPLSRTPGLQKCPNVRGLIMRVCIMNPKKPNSAMRHIAKVKLYRKKRITARIPGIGFGITKFNRVLVRGGRANDLPGVSYSLIRGVYDFPGVFGKKRRRSFYGVSQFEHKYKKKYIKKKLRKKL